MKFPLKLKLISMRHRNIGKYFFFLIIEKKIFIYNEINTTMKSTIFFFRFYLINYLLVISYFL